MNEHIGPGEPRPLGAHRTNRGLNFAVYARHATAVELLLFDDPDGDQPRVVALDPKFNRSQDHWHIEVPTAVIGDAVAYAYRVDGPNEGPHRYDAAKVLLDPYARGVHFTPAHARDAARGEGSTLGRAPLGLLPPRIPRAFDWTGVRRPQHSPERRVIYEMHVRGFTRRDPSVPEAHRGTFLGVIDKIPYLRNLGVTTVELLPIQQFDPDELNYWGYMTLGFFAPHRDYAAGDDPEFELKRMIRALHEADIEVVLDVVYNHTTEENEVGPTYNFRGFDNETYYLLEKDGRTYRDDAGTGNVFRTGHPEVRRLVLDSLRYWATEFHVDGFRYDLASILTRTEDGDIGPSPDLVQAIAHDPVLQPLLHIAEPWDLKAYQVGPSFPAPSWSQWNDKFRDDVRRFVKSDPGFVSALMTRLSGSPDLFVPTLPDARLSSQSVNFVVAHDGFCLNDLVTYDQKRNHANGHNNQDGSSNNNSWNCGYEGDGPDVPPEIGILRRRQMKNFMTLLMLANGVPMFLMGDEFGHTRGGNNNPYNQDNETSWLDWSRAYANEALLRFNRRLIAFRHRHPSLSRRQAWADDVTWFGVGPKPDTEYHSRSLAFVLHGAAHNDCDLYVLINAYWEALDFELQADQSGGWRKVIDTMNPSPHDIFDDQDAPTIEGRALSVGPRSIVVLRAPEP